MGDAMETADAAKFAVMSHQVGGHSTDKTSLRAFGGQILKPFQSKQRGEREHEFYQHVFSVDAAQDLPLYQYLRPLLPKYCGLVVVEETETPTQEGALHPGKYLALEDLTHGRSWPCIMDVKVGTRSYEDGASDEKIAYERSKFPLQTAVGFRVQGIKVYDPETHAYVEYDKHVGRGVSSQDELAALFAKFFPAKNPAEARRLLEAFIARLELFKQWFETQDQFAFIASSLLFLYDGEDSAADATSHAPDIRLIDFAHVTRPSPPHRDDGVLLGVTTLISIFQQLHTQLALSSA